MDRSDQFQDEASVVLGPLVLALREAGGSLDPQAAVERVRVLLRERPDRSDPARAEAGSRRGIDARAARERLVREGVVRDDAAEDVLRLNEGFLLPPPESLCVPEGEALVCAGDQEAQRQYDRDSALDRYGAKAGPCPGCRTPAPHLTWVYHCSPPDTWMNMCGRAGWLTLCRWCGLQVDYFLELMN